MKLIKLTKGNFAKVDDEDFELLSESKWHTQTGATKKPYAACGVSVRGKPRTILMHRVIMNAPMDKHVEHIDGDGFNNQKSNLRLCTRSQNLANQKLHTNNKSGIKGVCWLTKKQRWFAQIQVNGKNRFLGTHKKIEDAAAAYMAGAKKYFGEFSKT